MPREMTAFLSFTTPPASTATIHPHTVSALSPLAARIPTPSTTAYFAALIASVDSVPLQTFDPQSMVAFSSEGHMLVRNSRTIIRRERTIPFPNSSHYSYAANIDSTPISNRTDQNRQHTRYRCCAAPESQPLREEPQPSFSQAARQQPSAEAEWFQAAKSGDIPTLSRLVRTGAITSVNVTDPDTGRNAVHFAAIGAHLDSLYALFELARGVGGAQQDFSHHQANAVNLFAATDATGRSPLHYAVMTRSPNAIRIVDKLIDYGVNPNSLDSDGRSAADIALMSGRADIEQLIRLRSRALGG